jgi:hypothetical protein
MFGFQGAHDPRERRAKPRGEHLVEAVLYSRVYGAPARTG